MKDNKHEDFICRGIDKLTNQFLYGNIIYYAPINEYWLLDINHKQYRLKQAPDKWTGFYDRDNNKIYENDKCKPSDIFLQEYYKKFKVYSENDMIYNVEYKLEHGCWYLTSKFKNNFYLMDPYLSTQFNIIGNTHFNNDLL